MENRSDGKLRILHLRDIMNGCDGVERAITMAELLSLLGDRGVFAERKSVYEDLKLLRRYGMKIGRTCRGRYSRYYQEK